MRARTLMTSPALTVHVNDPLNVAAQRMWDYDIGALAVVTDEGKLTGMVTDRDACMACYTQGRALDEILVNSAMSRHTISVAPDASIEEVERLMSEHQVRRIPVVDREGRPIGMVSMNDIALASVKPDSMISHGDSKIAHTLAAICHRKAA